MFGRHDNLKRAISILGIVLALSPTLQHTHAFCHLAGCTASPSSAAAEAHDCSEHNCPFTRHNHSSVQGSTPDRCGDDFNDSQSAPCPCPPACWCHQSPEPLELPRNAPEPTNLLLFGAVYLDVAVLDTSRDEQRSRNAVLASLDSSARSAAQICAQLCRFLA